MSTLCNLFNQAGMNKITSVFASAFLLLSLTLAVLPLYAVSGRAHNAPDSKYSRNDFPSNFVFGAGTGAYQVEGAVAEDGRTPSIWDVFTHEGRMPDKSTGDVAADGYHKYKEDVKQMSDIGLEGYRFSISWSRLLPNGRGAINPKGLEYYNNLIDELIEHGIQPHATLYHLDLPLILEEEYLGWLSPKIIYDFTAYADVCFREFGDRVSHWTTLNEANILAIAGYDNGFFPPGRCSNCVEGNSSVEPYTVMHNALLAHASAARLYKEKYQEKQKGWIGINVYAVWFASMTNSTADIEAAQRAMDFYTGWEMNPLLFGDYPETMKKIVGPRMPSFTEHESKLVKGSFDFIGLNHYIALYVTDNPSKIVGAAVDFDSDIGVKISVSKDGTPTESFVPPSSVPYNPSGMQSLLEYFKDYYGNPPVYVQEHGYGSPYNETLNDTMRIYYLKGYIESILNAIRNGANTRGYFVWAFLDVFELLSGYQTRLGLVRVDFEDKELKRQPKLSAKWYSNFLRGKGKDGGMEMKNRNSDGSLLEMFFSSQ